MDQPTNAPTLPVSPRKMVAYLKDLLDRAHACPGSFTRRATIELAGLTVDVHAFDGLLADAVEQSLRHYPLARPLADGVDRMKVFIAYGGFAGMPEPATWGDAPYSPHQFAEILAAQGLRGSHFHGLDHWHLYDVGSRVALQLMRGPEVYPPWEPGAPLRPFLHWHYAERGMRLAHCGTLGVDGAGVMLAGAGGSGKSGTVIAGLLHGLQSVGDDYVLLGSEADGKGVVAHPLFSTLKQDPSGFQRLGLSSMLAGNRPLNWQGKYQFSIQDICADAVPFRLAIKAMLVPRVTGGDRTIIAPIPRREAMLALAVSSIYQMPGERESGFRFFSAVTNRLPCYRLELGREPAEVAERIGEFIVGNRA